MPVGEADGHLLERNTYATGTFGSVARGPAIRRAVGVVVVALARYTSVVIIFNEAGFNKSSCWQADKEVIGSSRVEQLCIYVYPAFTKYMSILFLNIFTKQTVTQS